MFTSYYGRQVQRARVKEQVVTQRRGVGVRGGRATERGNSQVFRILSLRSLPLGVVGWGEGEKCVHSRLCHWPSICSRGFPPLVPLGCVYMGEAPLQSPEGSPRAGGESLIGQSWVWSRCSYLKLTRATQSGDRVRAGGSAAGHTQCPRQS